MTSLTDTQIINASGGLSELAYATATGTPITVSATSSAYASATTIISDTTVVCDGSPTFLEFYSPSIAPSTTSGDYIIICLYRDASLITLWGQSRTPAAADDQKPLTLTYRDTPTAGVHTYAVKAYRITANGTVGLTTASGWTPTFLRISKIITASQWPAVTTGTIICTSSTRPASPFAGQQIYETDTNLMYAYSGSAWVKVVQQTTTGTAVTTNVWQTPTLAGTWANYSGGYQGARYIKDDTGTVFIEGLVQGGTGTVFTLAAGYRPLNTLIFTVIANNTVARLDVANNGTVTWNTGGTNAFVSLVCSFKASA